MIMRWIGRGAMVLAAAVAAVYAGDTMVLRWRMRGANAGEGAAFGTVTFFYEADLKNHKFEVFAGQPQQETCVRAIFPHDGYRPCWYASRKTIREVE
jgi:hypothetical protein